MTSTTHSWIYWYALLLRAHMTGQDYLAELAKRNMRAIEEEGR